MVHTAEFWPTTAMQADELIVHELQPEVSLALHPASAAARENAILKHLHTFLAAHGTSGHILVKPSTTGGRSAAHEVSAALLRSVLQAVRASRRDAVIVVADGPVYSDSFEKECRKLGWRAPIEEAQAEIADLNQDRWDERLTGWPISKLFLEAGVIISLCRAKTHRRFGVSLSTKGLLGTIVAKVTGRPKLIGRHQWVPWLLAQLTALAPPAFSIIDGEGAIEGEGPLHGKPTSSNFLVAGFGFGGPDVRATIEMGFDPVLVPCFLRPSRRRYDGITIDWSTLRMSKVDLLPSLSCPWLFRSLNRWNASTRNRKYLALAREAAECWPPRT